MDLYFEDVEIGDQVGPVERVVTDEQVAGFVGMSFARDDSSRFTDADAARKAGLPGAMVPGAMSMALVSQLLAGWSPTVTVAQLDCVFRQVVLHNVPLTITGVVTDKAVVNGVPRVDCDVVIQDSERGQLVTGRASVTLPTRA